MKVVNCALNKKPEKEFNHALDYRYLKTSFRRLVQNSWIDVFKISSCFRVSSIAANAK